MWLVVMSGIYWCGCKEVYNFLILLIPTPLVCSFLQQNPYFLFILKQEVSNDESCFAVHFIGSSSEPGTLRFLCNLGN